MKKIFGKFDFWQAAYILISLAGVWFLTRLWVPGGYAIAGHDSGLAINAKEFLTTRFYAWFPQGFGQDNTPHFGSIILHGIDYLLSRLAGVSYAGNQLVVFFWLSAIFISAYVFATSLKEKLGKIFPLIFPYLITFNFFILQSIFVVERAKYSILIASLLVLSIIINLLERRVSVILASLLSSLILFVFNVGSWLGAPLYGTLLVIFLTTLVYEIVRWIGTKNIGGVKRVLAYLFLTGAFSFVLNAYSILPYLNTFFKQDLNSIRSGAVISQNKMWLESMSTSTSFINLFRLQGIPDWYSDSNIVNAGHSYASGYVSNPYMIIVTFIFPFLALLSFIFAKSSSEKRLMALFGLLTAISMFFVAGSHKPLGFLYEFFYDFVPGFSTFRSPYFKFGSAFYIGFLGMISYSISSIVNLCSSKIRNKNWERYAGVALTLLAIIGWFRFHNVIFNPRDVFFWQPGLSTQFKIPEYVSDFDLWATQNNTSGERMLLLPPFNSEWKNDAYNWGYWSLNPLQYTLGSRNILVNESSLTGYENEWLYDLYSAVTNNDEAKFKMLAKRLGVGSILLRKDVEEEISWSGAKSHTDYEDAISGFGSVGKVQDFGEWSLYNISTDVTPKVSAISQLAVVPERYFPIVWWSFLDEYRVIAQESDVANNPAFLPLFSTWVDVFDCQSCLLEKRIGLQSLPEVNILPNSLLYGLKVIREESTLKQSLTNQSKADAYLGFSLRRAGEVKNMIDSGVNTRFILEDLKKMNDYLVNLQDILPSFSDPKSDFLRASYILNATNPIEIVFTEYIRRPDFGRNNDILRDEVVKVLWNIHKLKIYYDSLYDKDILTMDKKYSVRFSENGDSDLFIDEKSLPTDGKGDYKLPEKLFIDDEEISVGFEKVRKSWYKVDLFEIEPKGEKSVVLHFDPQENLFVDLGTSKEISSTGEKGCYLGKLASFDRNKKYNFSIEVARKDQTLRLYFLETESTKNADNFLHGENEEDVYPIITQEPFRYMYYPTALAEDPTVYLCGDNGEYPAINSIYVSEVFSPLLVVEERKSLETGTLPRVSFDQINSTKYNIEIKDAEGPFILLFNERYSQFWELSQENKNHFMIDGYANAWKIDKEGDFELTLEYKPQRLFLLGVWLSLGSFLVFVCASIFRLLKYEK
jgi:hypothetical protein